MAGTPRWLGLAAWLAAMQLALPSAVAQQYPDRPVRVVVGFPAGSGADILCRYFAEGMAKVSGATVIVENKPGATGNIGTETVAKAKPDGYTILMGASANLAGGPHIYKDLPWDPQRDLEPITTFAQLGFVLTVSATNPAKTVAELTEQLKAKAGKATFGFGNTSGLAASSLYAAEAGFKVTPVAYKANPTAVSDVAGGQIDYVFSDAVFAIGQQKLGKVKILAATTPQRMTGLPTIPTMREVGLANATLAPWWAAFAPAKTPREITARLEGWLNKVASAPEAREFLERQGAEPLPGSAERTKAMLAEALKDWARITSIAKIEPQ